MGIIQKIIDEMSLFYVKNSKGEFYYRYGDFHRENGPAVIFHNNLIKEKWYYKGKCHRENGPAITYENGKLEWCRHGFLHSYNDEPAIVYNNGTTSWNLWYDNGFRHRITGPAVIMDGFRHEFWLLEKQYENINEWTDVLVEKGYKSKQEALMLYLKWR